MARGSAACVTLAALSAGAAPKWRRHVLVTSIFDRSPLLTRGWAYFALLVYLVILPAQPLCRYFNSSSGFICGTIHKADQQQRVTRAALARLHLSHCRSSRPTPKTRENFNACMRQQAYYGPKGQEAETALNAIAAVFPEDLASERRYYENSIEQPKNKEPGP